MSNEFVPVGTDVEHKHTWYLGGEHSAPCPSFVDRDRWYKYYPGVECFVEQLSLFKLPGVRWYPGKDWVE